MDDRIFKYLESAACQVAFHHKLRLFASSNLVICHVLQDEERDVIFISIE